jgi:hypothetical protein
MMEMEVSLDRRIITRLSLAVLLTDDFTQKKEITGKVQVSIPSLKLKAVMNHSGYYNFCDLPDDTHTMQIQSDYYIDKEIDIPIPHPGYVHEVTLQPNPLYPFPIWATLLRGGVSHADGNAIPGALVECVAKGLSTTTSARGEYVLYFPVNNFPVDKEDEKIDIKVTPQGKLPKTIPNVEIKKCKTTSLSVTY